VLFETERLTVRTAEPDSPDMDLIFDLWTDPRVMTPVGFPQGLPTSRSEIFALITSRAASVLSAILIVELTADSTPIGQCKLGELDEQGVSETDVKLQPQFWRQGFGTEIKRGMVDYLFTKSACQAVRATPNRDNIASQKMQEAVGAHRTGEGVCVFPESMRAYTVDVPHYIYMVYRKDWEQARQA
jgi:RimJ/RimL family protein N-acetyltransferase